jgi:asparagine synthase (glutamine-hydrolysing)
MHLSAPVASKGELERSLSVPGIAGIISPLERDALPAILSRMIGAMRHEGAQARQWNGNGVGLAAAGSAAASMLAERSDCVLALAGRVVADMTLHDRLRMAPGCRGPERMPQCLLDLYLRLGPQALEGLNGAYAAVIWDDERARLTIVTDRGGHEPLYYWQQGSRLVFASRMRAVAAHPRFNHRVDATAVLDLLAAGQMLDERTLFADARALPPATRLTFERGHLEITSYWQPVFYTSGGSEIYEDEAIDGLADRVIAAAARMVQSVGGESQWVAERSDPLFPGTYPPAQHSPAVEHLLKPSGLPEEQAPADETHAGSLVCLLLTGGLDSRLLAGALVRGVESGQVSAATIGHDRARDVRFGAEIARAAGMPYSVLPSNPRYMADYAEACIWRTEGNINLHAAWILGASNHLIGENITAVMTGVGAEAVSGRHWLAEQPVSTRDEAFQRLAEARWGYSKAAALLRPEIRGSALTASRDSLRRTLNAAPAEHLLGWADYFAYRQGRRHPTGSILADDAIVLEPFFDHHLVDYAHRLPPHMRDQGRLYKKMIVQRFPEMASIGYTDSGTLLMDDLNGTPPLRQAQVWLQQLSRRVRRRLAWALPFLHLPSAADNPAHAIYYNEWLRTASRSYITSLLNQDDLYADFLDAAQVRRLLEDHMAGRANAYRLIGAIASFALWRKLMA